MIVQVDDHLIDLVAAARDTGDDLCAIIQNLYLIDPILYVITAPATDIGSVQVTVNILQGKWSHVAGSGLEDQRLCLFPVGKEG